MIAAALRAEAEAVWVPVGLRERVRRAAYGPRPPARWLAGRAPQVVAAAALALLLAGWGARHIWVVPAQPVGEAAVPKPMPSREVSLPDLAGAVDFPVALPTYLPEGMTLWASVIRGDSQEANARLRVVVVTYQKEGLGTVSVQEWRADQAEPFAPGDPEPAVLDTAPWYKVLGSRPVDVGGVPGTAMNYLLSGMHIDRVYWHKGGINYAVSGNANVSLKELLKVAQSIPG